MDPNEARKLDKNISHVDFLVLPVVPYPEV